MKTLGFALAGAVLVPRTDSNDGLHFATAGEKGIVKIWSGKSSALVAEQTQEGPFEEGSQLTGLYCDPDGQLISTSEDAKIQFLGTQVRSCPCAHS